MLLFLFISSMVISLTRSEENDLQSNSKISLIDEDLKSYEISKLSVLRHMQSFKCVDSITSCSNHGICNQNKTDCICEAGYTTFPLEQIPLCNYVQKKQLVAFLCELFLGFGAGHFYTERYTHAGLKLAAFLFGIYVICLFPLSAKYINDRCENDMLVIAISCFYYCCALGLAFWFIYDLVQFGSNNYLDGNKIPLLPWGVPSNT
jgi:TM2 domain-containing membrane protein YozV